MSVTYSGDGITFNDGSSITGGWTGFKNRIINGDMRIDQRLSGSAGTPVGSGDYVSVDRWAAKALNQSSKFSMQRITGGAPVGFSHYLACVPVTNTTVSSADTFYIQQCIEGYNIQDLNWGTSDGKPITISFWVKSNVTGTYGGFLFGASHSVPYSYTINSSGTWEYKTVTISAPPAGSSWNLDNSSGLYVCFNFGSGSNYTATPGTWVSGYNGRAPTGQANIMASTSNYFYITGVQVEKGSSASSFEYRPFGTEMQLCMRYYQEIIGSSIEGFPILMNYGTAFVSSNYRWVSTTYQVPMRSSPSVTWYPDPNAKTNPGKARYFVGTAGGAGNYLTPYGYEIGSKSLTLKTYNEYAAFTCYGVGAGYAADAEL